MPRHRIVIIGSGFAGLTAARRLKKADADITILARTSHHLFQPLLYQVATGILSEGDIAPTTREILRKQKNVTVLQALVEEIDVEARVVKWRNHNKYEQTEYDTLIVAAGAGQSYFGNDHFAVFAPGMKTIDDALELRARIFGAFELAEIETDPALVGKLLTFVVVGAGPTGVEMAGQIRELASHTLKGEFRNIDPTKARVILVDGAEHPLPPFGEKLGHKTEEALAKLGGEMKMNAFVTDVDAEGVTLKYKSGEEERIESVCKVWAAGVSASPLGRGRGDGCRGGPRGSRHRQQGPHPARAPRDLRARRHDGVPGCAGRRAGRDPVGALRRRHGGGAPGGPQAEGDEVLLLR